MGSENRGEYLQTTRPRSWIILSAVLVLLMVYLLWAFSKNMLETQKVNTIVTEDGVYGCLGVEEGEPKRLKKGMEVVFAHDKNGVIRYIDRYLYVPEELNEKFGVEIMSQIELRPFTIIFPIDTDVEFEVGTVHQATVVMGESNPIHLWLKEG